MALGDNSYQPPRPLLDYGNPVAVRLDLGGLYPHPADAPQKSVPDGWDLAGPIHATALASSWIRSARGMWLVNCDFDINSADGRRTLPLTGQLVPAHLLRILE